MRKKHLTSKSPRYFPRDFNFAEMKRYQNLKTLGDGTYGSVVLARNHDTGETVAIKMYVLLLYSVVAFIHP